MRFVLVFTFLMSLFMSLFMSGVVTAINLGVDGHFVDHWIAAWIRVFPIAFVAILIFRPAAQRLTVKLVGPPDQAAAASAAVTSHD